MFLRGILKSSGSVVITNKINPSLKILAAPTELASVIANMMQNAIQNCDATSRHRSLGGSR